MSTKRITTKNLTKRLSLWVIVVAGILMIPFFAKLPWSLGDFIFAGAVLFGSATVYEVSTKNVSNNAYRVIVGFGVAMFVLLVWAWAVA